MKKILLFISILISVTIYGQSDITGYNAYIDKELWLFGLEVGSSDTMLIIGTDSMVYKMALSAGAVNIYNSDGELTANRTLNAAYKDYYNLRVTDYLITSGLLNYLMNDEGIHFQSWNAGSSMDTIQSIDTLLFRTPSGITIYEHDILAESDIYGEDNLTIEDTIKTPRITGEDGTTFLYIDETTVHVGSVAGKQRLNVDGAINLDNSTDGYAGTVEFSNSHFWGFTTNSDSTQLDSLSIETDPATRERSFNDGGGVVMLPGNIISDSLYIIKSGDYTYFRSKLSDSSHVAFRTYERATGNENYSLYNSYLISPSAANTVGAYTGGTLIHSTSDESAPIKTDNIGYIGANHGFNLPIVVMSGHGKTSASYGSIWYDGTSHDYELFYVGNDTLKFRPVALYSGDDWYYDITISGNLTYRSGGGDQTTIVPTALNYEQQTPCYKNHTIKYYINGIDENTTDFEGYVNYFDVVEQYTVTDPRSVTIEEPTDWTDGDDWFTITATYRFQDYGAITIYTKLEIHDSLSVDYMGFTQAAKLYQDAYDDVTAYMPKVASFVGGGKTWDFEEIDTLTTNPTATLDINTTNSRSATNPPDRFMQFLKMDGLEPDVGFVLGYNLNYVNTDTTFRSNIQSSYWNIFTTSSKQYPRAIQETTEETLIDTTFYNICYRQFFDPEYDDNLTALYFHSEGAYDYVYMTVHKTLTNEKISIPSKYTGKNISVIESKDMTIESYKVQSDGIDVSCSSTHGYLVLKLSGETSGGSDLWQLSGGDAYYNGSAEISGNLEIPTSTATTGQINQNGLSLYHNFGGSYSYYLGEIAGNFTASGASYNFGGGYKSLNKVSSGDNNISLGYTTLSLLTTGSGNVGLGGQVLSRLVGGTYNLALGFQSLRLNTSGSYNVAIGRETGENNLTGSSNVFIGNQAGQDETGSNTLYIENSNSATPLIYGDFSTEVVKLSEVLQLTPVSTPTATPALGMIYCDSDDNELYFYNGSAWEQLSP